MRALKITLKVLGWLILSVLLLASATLLTVVISARTNWGHKKLLSVALPQIRKQLLGDLKIGAIDGDLVHGLILRDVELTDKEHQPAVRVRSLGVHYNLLGLAHHTIDLTELDADGVWVHARVMRDGKMNLAELTKPSPPKPEDPNAKPYRIHVGKAKAELEAIYDPPPAPDAKRIHATVKLDVSADVNGGDIAAKVNSLEAHTLSPAVALVSMKGALHDHDGALSADKLDLVVSAEGRELDKLAPAANLRGRWSVAVRADGPADKLRVSVVARPPAGKLDLEAELTSKAGKAGQPAPSIDALAWKATVEARGIDPAAAVLNAPHGSVRLDAHGEGRGQNGTIDLTDLEAVVAGATVKARAHANTDGDVKATAHVNAPDLSKLRALGVSSLKDAGGSLAVDAKIARVHHLVDIDADGSGSNVSLAKNKIGALALHVHLHDFLGSATVTASKIRTPQIQLDTLALTGNGDTHSLSATLSAKGPQKTDIELAVHGKPELARDKSGTHVVGAVMSIDTLSIARFDQKVALAHPATLKVRDSIALAGFVLQTGRATLALDGDFDRKTNAFTAKLAAKSLDINRLVHFAKPAQDLPTTSLDVNLTAHGTTQAPVADLAIEGWSNRHDVVVTRISYHGNFHYGDERAKGQFTVTALDESVKGKLDVPVVFTGDRKLSLDVVANNLTMRKVRKVLPAKFGQMEGRLDGHVKLDGTTMRPRLDLDVHGRSLTLGANKNDDVELKINYADKRLAAQASLTLEKSATANAGALSASVHVPVSISSATLTDSARFIAELEHKTPVDVLITLKKIDLSKLPFTELGIAPPVDAGMVDGSIKLKGTMHEPLFDAAVEAHGLKKGKLDKLDVVLDADYKGKRATAKLDVHLRDAPLLAMTAAAPIDVERVLDGKNWKDVPVTVDANIPAYPLSRLQDMMPKLDGALTLAAQVRGTVAHPTAKLDADIAGLNLGAMKYDHFKMKGAFDGQTVTARLDAKEQKGGVLTADATLPLDASKDLHASLRASGFYIDVENLDLTNPRLVKGTLDAKVDANGPRKNPTIAGEVRFSDGKLALASDPRIYERIKLDVKVVPGKITLAELEAHLGTGSLTANGDVLLDGLTPKSVDIRAYARKFPVEPGTFGMWVDADVAVKGQGDAKGMSGAITITKGTANLPKLSAGKKLQSTGPLKDVRFVDAAAIAAEKKRKQSEKSAPSVEVAANIPGPFHVRSKEISCDLKGQVSVAIAGPVTRLRGHVEEMSTGWIELLGHRYDIEKASVGFGGEAEIDPELDIRLTRQLTQAMIVIEVHGTAGKPHVEMSSDPPIYDQSQIIMAIISGDPGAQNADAGEGLDSKVTGAVSSLIVGKIKDQIAPNLPIDVLKVDTGSTGYDNGGLTDTRIEVGKFLTPTIYISYVHQFGNTMVGTQHFNSNEADVNWRFYKNYELDTAFGDAEVGHVNVFWTIRY
jgi:autotransporter translocation and assembly factor TamB